MKLSNFKIGKVQILLSLVVWVLIFTMPVLFSDTLEGKNWDKIFKTWESYSIVFILFLINRFLLLPLLFFKGKRVLYFVSITSLIILFAIINFASHSRFKQRIPPHHRFGIENTINDKQLPPKNKLLHKPPPRPGRESIPPFANLFIMSILVLGFDTGLIFSNKWLQAEKNKLKIEKESIANKMSFLQNQISPHFFMNTLNNIHALIDIDTNEAQKAIIKLSKMMDYMLYESQTAKILIQQEMEFIKSYVELMKLRFTNDVDIILDIPTIIPAVKIPPLLTISFIENAFKHGVSYETNSFIHIKFIIHDNELIFNIKNSKHKNQVKKKNSGIGLQNSINRLDLIYNSNYKLKITDQSENTFEVTLNIPV